MTKLSSRVSGLSRKINRGGGLQGLHNNNTHEILFWKYDRANIDAKSLKDNQISLDQCYVHYQSQNCVRTTVHESSYCLCKHMLNLSSFIFTIQRFLIRYLTLRGNESINPDL